MRSGIMLGAACMLDGMVDRMEEELGKQVNVVVTGGIARFVIPMCKTPMVYDKDLLLKGLAALYKDNVK
jgi:type III pantothenate kinase